MIIDFDKFIKVPLKQLDLTKNDLENIFRIGIRSNFKSNVHIFKLIRWLININLHLYS